MEVPPNPRGGIKQAGETARVPDTREAAGGRQKRGKAVIKQGLPNCANPCPCPAWGDPACQGAGRISPARTAGEISTLKPLTGAGVYPPPLGSGCAGLWISCRPPGNRPFRL